MCFFFFFYWVILLICRNSLKILTIYELQMFYPGWRLRLLFLKWSILMLSNVYSKCNQMCQAFPLWLVFFISLKNPFLPRSQKDILLLFCFLTFLTSVFHISHSHQALFFTCQVFTWSEVHVHTRYDIEVWSLLSFTRVTQLSRTRVFWSCLIPAHGNPLLHSQKFH